MNIIPTENFSETFWAYNLPLQIWPTEETHEEDGEEYRSYKILNYMPRKEIVCELEEVMTKEQMQKFCRNSAEILRNLASLFDTFAEGKIGYIYYPDKPVSEAIEEFVKET